MIEMTSDYDAVTAYLIAEFGAIASIPSHGIHWLVPLPELPVLAPPIGRAFEVLEPLQTRPHPSEVSKNYRYGLTSCGCIPVGIYCGLNEEIRLGNSTYRLLIKRPQGHGRSVYARVGVGTIDWRAVRALRTFAF